MLYLILIASLCIYKAAGQTCSSITDVDECESTEGCSLYDSGICHLEGGEGCCIDATTTTTYEPTTATTTDSPTLAPTCPTDLDKCEYYTSATCCPSECVSSTSTLCITEGGPGCCTTATTDSPTSTTTTDAPTTTTTTDEPTLAPTCPDSDVCEDYTDATQYGCCPDGCIVVTTGTCYYEGGPECCKTETDSPTTSTTTAEPTESTTTQEPTTASPTESTTTTEEPTTSTTTASPTASTTTEEPTTSTITESPTESTTTTEEPTTSTTTVSPTESTTTTEEAETTEQESEEETTEQSSEEETTESSSDSDSSDSSSDESWPTPKPTMKSAEKWEMIHPAYKGNDGELLWHVYYGDFSSDNRFDSFRKAEQWDTKEIKPIIMHDPQFKGYRHANSKKFKQESAVITDNNTASGASSYGSWLIGISAVLIVLFAVWYKYGPKDKTSEYTPLLTEEKVQYDQ